MQKKVIPLLLLFILLLVLTRALFLSPREQSQVVAGKFLPTFSAYDVNKRLISIAQWKGQWMLLHFWASWCDNCQLELPVLQQYQDQLTIIGLNYKDETPEASSWLKIWSPVFAASLRDPQGKIGLDLGVVATPESFLINPQGKIVYRHQGPLTHDTFQTEILTRLHQ